MSRRKRDYFEKTRPEKARKVSTQTLFLAAVVITGGLLVTYLILAGGGGPNGNAEAAVSQLQLEDIPFDGARAYEYLKRICTLGPRPSGSAGMARQREMVMEHFRQCGGQVELQSFRYRHPVDGSAVPMANVIVRWHPERTERILLCAHYDTLPFPLRDPQNRRGTFVGANDGASGVALLMELAHRMPQLQSNYGVDFALFDGEEFIFNERQPYFIGSRYFAERYVKDRPPYRYRYGVLLDMVGDAKLQIYQERYSMRWKDTRPLVEDIWATARRLGVKEFIPRKGHTIRDDHLPLHNDGKIPCCNVIDFDYPYWHTQADTPDKCSALSLAKVGWVISEWLQAVR